MIKVVFFFENEWAFGAVHNELAKHLFKFGISCQILHWAKQYTRQEIQELDKSIDFWITNPYGARDGLMTYGIKPNRIGLILHHPIEIGHLEEVTKNHHFLGVAAIERSMHNSLLEKGVENVAFLPVRISVDHYRRNSPMPVELKRIGFAGASRRSDPRVKRFFLVEQAAQNLSMDLRVADTYHNSWITNQSFYSNVDAIVVASTSEGVGLPLMEGGAGGCLVLTSPVGCYEELITPKGADVLPMEDGDFLKALQEKIHSYVQNPKEFRDRCEEIREHAKTYDWSYVIHLWREQFEKFNFLRT